MVFQVLGDPIRPKMATTVTAAFADFSVSSSNLISIAAGNKK